MLKDFLTRLRLMLMRRTHREVDEELAFHLAREVELNVAAGMTAVEARRQAAIAFGGVERAREQCREERPGYRLETLLQDVRYAVRGFRRNPVRPSGKRRRRSKSRAGKTSRSTDVSSAVRAIPRTCSPMTAADAPRRT